MLKQMMLSVSTIAILAGAAAVPINEIPTHAAAATTAVKTDPWGRAIRTTNLPKNYKDYPYILANLPNEMYEMEHKNHVGKPETAKDFLAKDVVTKEAVDKWINMVKDYGQLTLNINYKTVNYEWIYKYLELIVNQGDISTKDAQKYVSWVKENKIQVQGKLTPEPSMIFVRDGKVVIRSQIEFKLINFNKNERIFNDLFYPANKFKKGVTYKGYTDIALATNVFGGSFVDTLRISGSVSFFQYSLLKESRLEK
jgi:hypothetical protein